MRSSAPVVGFNHNVKHGNRVYHVQTEDSGLPHAHFITHLFLGGNIVATLKSSYADRAGEPDLAKLVRAMMEEQHKTMLRRLVAGEFTEMSEHLAAPHYEPGVLATGQTGPAAVNVAKTAPMSGEAAGRPSAASAQPARAVASAPVPKPPIPQQPVARASPPSPAKPEAAAAAKPAAPVPAQPVWQPAPPGKSNPSGRRMPGAPLPQTTRMPPAARSSLSPPTLAPSGSGRPAPNAPARPNLFAEGPKVVEAPHEDLPTLFAEELISEKSLDEVILAFLSADLEPQK
ncbi:MAG: hypothetical protein ACJ783_01120 [Myxococcales bacterium]